MLGPSRDLQRRRGEWGRLAADRLLPLAGLDGRSVFVWNRVAWGAAYAVGLLAFLVVLMPMPFAWGAVHAPFATWLASYLGYALMAVGLWVWLRPRAGRPGGQAALPA